MLPRYYELADLKLADSKSIDVTLMSCQSSPCSLLIRLLSKLLSKLSAVTMLSMLAVTGAQASFKANANTDTAIRFDKGQVSTTVTGKLSPKQNEHWYQFDATSGQYAIINITPRAGTSETANVGVLHMPNGSQDGTKGGIIYQGCLPASGKYRLRIARNLMATRGKTAGYTTEIILLPKYASESLCQ